MELNEGYKSELIRQFKELLHETNRDGIDKLIMDLEMNGFFEAPASREYHGNYAGGLLEHTMKVMECLHRLAMEFPDELGDKYPTSTLVIVALLHDICKTAYYKPVKLNRKIDGRWQEVPGYEVADSFPTGHGEKSVIMAMRHIELTEDEIYAIRWHMGPFDDSFNSYAGGKAYNAAKAKSKLVTWLFLADMIASQVMDI